MVVAFFAVQGVILSVNRTPCSRASCSNVTGKNEPDILCQLWHFRIRKYNLPTAQTANTSAANP